MLSFFIFNVLDTLFLRATKPSADRALWVLRCLLLILISTWPGELEHNPKYYQLLLSINGRLHTEHPSGICHCPLQTQGAMNCYTYSDLTGGKTVSQRKSSRAKVTSLGNGRAALSPTCSFTAFPKPMLFLTNSTSQYWAPSSGLSPYQQHGGLALQLSLFHRGRTSGPES